MKRITTAGLAIMVAALVLAAAWIASANGASAGGSPTISVDSATIAVGSDGTVAVHSLNMASPGLGAWSLNVIYDPSLLSQTGCTAQNGSVCNPAFAADTIRVSGATAAGLVGDTVLASIGFACTSTGSSPLTITIDTLADGTPGAPADIHATVVDGTITCIVAPTPTEPPGAGAEFGAQCLNSIDDDGDGFVNDGCPASGAPETGAQCLNNMDDDGDGLVNDGCPAVVSSPPPAGGNGFPAAGGTYVGHVPGEGAITLVIEPNGQGISAIFVSDLVTVCGTINQALTFDPALDIHEPGFHYDLFAFSQGAATLSMTGFFAENGTIPISLEVNTSNVNFPAGESPCTSNNQVIPLVLVRQAVAPPPSGGTYNPPPSGGGTYTGSSLPHAGSGGLGINATNPITWLVAAMAGAGLAWLSAGFAGAGLAAVTGSGVGEQRSRATRRGFMPAMRPLRHNAQARPSVDYSVLTPRRETPPAPERPRSARTDKPSIGEFQAPKRPDRR